MTNLTIAQKQAIHFLNVLDPKRKLLSFRTFDDKPKSNRPELLGNLSGSFVACEQQLRDRNKNEAGVFLVINDGGHKDKDITRVRAVFADTDGAPLKPIIDALAPHFVIATSLGKWHVYWLVDDEFPLHQFKPIQSAIAQKYGTDGSVNNLSRVMRLPGFFHNKGEPFEVRFTALNKDLPRYSADQIISGLALTEHMNIKTLETTTPHRAPNLALLQAMDTNTYSVRDVEEMLRFIDPWCDRVRWMNVLFALAEEYGEEGLVLAVRWSRGDLWRVTV